MPQRVLIVDDNAIVREVLQIVLSIDDDFEVCGVARNGTAAVMLAGEVAPDIVILDLEMPGPSGVDILPTILREAPAAAVFLYSASDDLGSINQARNAGAAGYFVKGVDDLDDMLAVLRQQRGPASAREASTVVAELPSSTSGRREAPAA